MKIQIPVCVAIAMAFISSTAYGQIVQQPQRSVAPQQNWTVPIVRASTAQEPALAVQSNATPAPVAQGAYDSVVGSSCCDNGRTGLRGRLQGMGCRGSNDCECNDCNTCQPDRYLTVFGGATNFNDIGLGLLLTDPTGGAPNSVDTLLNQNNGWTIGGGVGRRFRERLRGELEWSYRNASLNTADISVNGVDQGNFAMDGQLNIYRQSSNLLIDLNPNGRFNLYFGGGVGIGFLDLDAQESTQPLEARIQTSSFIYQGIVGMSGKINDRSELFVDYRYFGTDHFEVEAISPLGGANTKVDITSNDIIFGIRVWR